MKRRICLLAHNVRSLWNVGSFFRTCDAFAVEKIYLTGYTGHPPRKEIAKTALGAEESVPWEYLQDPVTIVNALRSDGWSVVALELIETAVELRTYSPPEQICLVVGHELSGVPQEILGLAEATIKISMLGTKESLNVAVAAGIALHHLRNAKPCLPATLSPRRRRRLPRPDREFPSGRTR
ncbi:RNA methyltransferase [Candidatus Peregrinibacteria bacterium]|nr:RNA methyltransferase [Candidatus Peregrinibacteria bacterium]